MKDVKSQAAAVEQKPTPPQPIISPPSTATAIISPPAHTATPVAKPEPAATLVQQQQKQPFSKPLPTPLTTEPAQPPKLVSSELPAPQPRDTEKPATPTPTEITSVNQRVPDAAPKEPTIPRPAAVEPKPSLPPQPATQQPQRPTPQVTEPPQLERAVTRVSSGAIRQKSVSEILAGSLKAPRPAAEKAAEKAAASTTKSYPTTPSALRPKNQLPKRRERDRNQVSTVVFGKQPKRSDDKSVTAPKQQGTSPADDYFTPLFIEGFISRSSWMKPLGALLNQAHKTISSPDAMLAYEDDQACKILKRVYLLQHTNKWSLRQRERCAEPTRPPSHMDVLLQEMKWMRTDFREERKWKMATARILATACAKWHTATPEERIALQVSARPPPKEPAGQDVDMLDAEAIPVERMPQLVKSDSSESGLADEVDIISPSAIFALSEDQMVFPLRQSPTSDLLLSELPLYGSPLKVPSSDIIQPDYDPDALWRRPALPLSKYVEGDMKLVTEGQPTWQSKFMYEDESDDEDFEKYPPTTSTTTPASRKNWLPPEKNDVALFNPEMKQIRDRLHANHQFRPPTEHPMPPPSFYENRIASQWTAAEDEELRNLANQFQHNWSLISEVLTPRSAFVSGAERRTAWECFERWLQLEPLSPDMAKTQYFRTYNHRIESAQRVVLQQHQAAQQQAAATGQPPPKRRQCVPVRVERRHGRRHINLIGSMMKVAKKRETTAQKQQAQATMIAMRKANENSQQQQPRPQAPVKTPRDYSIMRWERDQAMAEKIAQYAQRHEAQKRVSLQVFVRTFLFTFFFLFLFLCRSCMVITSIIPTNIFGK